MGQELLDRERRDRQAGRLRLVGQRAGKVGAGLQQIDHHEAEQQRDKGGADEPAHRLGEHAAELGAGAHMRDAADERGEHQRRDDHLDQAQEQHGDQVYVGRDFHPAVGHIVEDDGPHHNAKRHRDQDVLRKPAGHSRTPVFPATASLADLNGDATSLRRFARLPECSRCEMRARRLASPQRTICAVDRFMHSQLHQERSSQGETRHERHRQSPDPAGGKADRQARARAFQDGQREGAGAEGRRGAGEGTLYLARCRQPGVDARRHLSRRRRGQHRDGRRRHRGSRIFESARVLHRATSYSATPAGRIMPRCRQSISPRCRGWSR